jgi:hypothetical protein
MALGTYVSDGSTAPSYPPIPSGFYTARLKEIEEREHEKLGNYILVTWEIESPEEYVTRWIWERFYLNHPEPYKRKFGIGHYNDFLLQVAGIPEGGKDDPDLLLDKVCVLEVQASIYNGRDQANVKSRQSLTAATLQQSAGIALPQTPQSSSVPFDDEIPFK